MAPKILELKKANIMAEVIRNMAMPVQDEIMMSCCIYTNPEMNRVTESIPRIIS